MVASYKLIATVASEAMGIGKSSEVLTVLGGKASCRRKFVLNLHLLDEYGNLAAEDTSIVASVAYAHDHSLVVRDDKQFLAEPPLFTTFNGVEFPAQERPTRMVGGRASFKLAISLLSSKCDNRLFCICFTPLPPPDGGAAIPICEPCYSKPIRSISRKRTPSTPLTIPLLAGDANNHSPSAANEDEAQKITSPGGSSSENGVTPRGTQQQQPQPQQQAAPPPRPECCTASLIEAFVDRNPSAAAAAAAAACGRLCNKSSLSLRLSPSTESNSGTLTAESCINESKDHWPVHNDDHPGSRPLPSPITTTRPFRPYASIGPCKLPLSEFHLGFTRSACFASTEGQNGQNSPHETILEKMQQRPMQQQQQLGLPLPVVAQQQNKSEVSLEEEEKSLNYIEVSLQEVHKELQRRKEELRSKKRRLLEDETRMHNIIFQSSSWIESLSGRFSL